MFKNVLHMHVRYIRKCIRLEFEYIFNTCICTVSILDIFDTQKMYCSIYFISVRVYPRAGQNGIAGDTTMSNDY